MLLDLFPAASEFEKAYIERAKFRGWATLRHLPPGTGRERLLDVGSMSGMYGPAYIELWRYAEVSLVGTDAPPDGKIVRREANGRTYTFPSLLCNIELQRWPFADESFDPVVCTEVLEHMVFDPMFAVNEMCRVLKTGGRALVTVPNAASDTCLTFLVNDRQPGYLRQYFSDALQSGRRDINTVYNLGHFHEYTAPELVALTKANGFGIEYLGGISPYPPPLDSFRLRLLKKLVHALFPRSQRVRDDILVAILKKESFTPLEQVRDRYPQPLYRPLSA